MKDVTFCVLLYGSRPGLEAMHRRCLDGVRTCAPDSPILAWCNQVGPGTLAAAQEAGRVIGGIDGLNTPKYPAMRRLLAEVRTEWVGWLDDDTWLRPECKLRQAWAKLPPGAVYAGQEMQQAHPSGYWEWVQGRPWFQGRQPYQHRGRPCIHYAAGCWWFLRMDLARELDWPDPALVWRGGDRLLGEAVWQAGHELVNFRPGHLVPGGSISRHDPIRDPHPPPPWDPVKLTVEQMRLRVAGMSERELRLAVADLLFERQA